jgi:hypothetical protein
MKYAVFWDVARVALVRNNVLEERIVFIIRVTRFGEVGTKLTVNVPPKRRSLQEPHGVTSQKTAFFFFFLLLFSTHFKCTTFSYHNSFLRSCYKASTGLA